MHIAILAGDGIGPDIMAETERVLARLALPDVETEHGLVGAAAWREHGHPLPDETLALARRADAILFGAVGDPECDDLEPALRPEAALLGLRKELGLFANLRPVRSIAGLEDASPLRPEIAHGIDIMIVRELTGDAYFGEKRRAESESGVVEAHDDMRYDAGEVARIAHVACRIAEAAGGDLVSVDKANVLESSRLWRETVAEVAGGYSDVALSHLYVDNAAMQLVREPRRFTTMVTGNLFGDILSDLASACVGSIGLLPSASLGEGNKGMYEPIHGSAPDIAGTGNANPCAMILSLAMMLRHSFAREGEAARIEAAVAGAIADGVRGRDLGGTATTPEIGEEIVRRVGIVM